MKRVDDLIEQLDHFVDAHSTSIVRIGKQYFTIFSITILSLLSVVVLVRTLLEKPYEKATIIADDLKQLSLLLGGIDKECNILSIINNQGSLNFLTVEKFSGSQVGCLNLAYPHKWDGPYLKRNPSMQGKFYEIIKIKEGVFIIPGAGVELPNGECMGKTILINNDSPIKTLMKPGGALYYGEGPLAIQLNFIIGDWDSAILSSSELDDINKTVIEFYKAVPAS